MKKYNVGIIKNVIKIKGIILAGGKGRRLYPLTKSINKALLPIGGKPMISYAINQLVEAGIKDIIMIIRPEDIVRYKELLRDGKHFGIKRLQYVLHPAETKGMAQAIELVEPFIQKDEKIISTCADVIIENGIKSAVNDFISQSEGARIVAFEMRDTAGFGFLEYKKDKITNYPPKDKNRHGRGIVESGTYMFHYDVFEKIKKMKIPKKGESNIRDLFDLYIKKNNLYFNIVDGWWSDAGNSLEEYKKANKRYEGKQ